MDCDSRNTCAVARKKNNHRRYYIVFLGLFLGVLVCAVIIFVLRSSPLAAMFGLGESWSEKDLERTALRGNMIILAIESYRLRNGVLPTSLGDLVPEYIEHIDPPAVGDGVWDYGYMRSDTTKFYLGVDSKYAGSILYFGPEFYNYNSIDRSWNLFQDDS